MSEIISTLVIFHNNVADIDDTAILKKIVDVRLPYLKSLKLAENHL